MYNNLQSYLHFLNFERSAPYFSAIFTFVSRPIFGFSLPLVEFFSFPACRALPVFADRRSAEAEEKPQGGVMKKEKQNTCIAAKIFLRTENFNKD